MLGVLPNKFVKGCDTLQSEQDIQHFQNTCHEVMHLQEMLNTEFRTDAHFTCYNLVDFDRWPRLNKSILPEIRNENSDIVLAYFAFDYDNPEHKEWKHSELEQFAKLVDDCEDEIINSWSAIYTSQHGARLIYTLSSPVPVDIGEQHLSWMFKHFQDHGFSLIDEACKDWTRLMRCPKVMRDGEPTWEQSYFTLAYRSNIILDINKVGKRSPKAIATKSYFNRTSATRPALSEIDTYLFRVNQITHKRVQTDFYKRAKRLLKESEYLDLLFNDCTPDWEQGTRNNEICRMIGTVVPVLLKGAGATIKQIYSLIIQPVLTLDSDQDWIEHSWNALVDIYDRETALLNQQREEQAQAEADAEDTLLKIAEGMRGWCDKVPLDDDAARDFVKANSIASISGFYYIIGEEGNYIDFPVRKDDLIPRIRKTHANKFITTSKINYAGELVDSTCVSIQNEFCTPVNEVKMKPVGEYGGFIEDINGMKPSLVLSTFCRNDQLTPTYNSYVDEWLFNLFGKDNYEKGCSWIGNALAFEEGLICALSLEGASNAGKKLLSIGLSECLKGCPENAGPDDVNKQSDAFTRTPFLVIDEAWPHGLHGTATPADRFKSFTGGDGIIINPKFKPQLRILCPVRIILTANDDNIVRTLLKGKDMTIDNQIAVGERLFHIKVSQKAAIYLRSIGGRGFTGREGFKWIRPDSGNGRSDFVVAKHFLYLYKNRTPVDPSQRYLVMGNSGPGGATSGTLSIIEKLVAESNNVPVICEAILKIADSDKGNWLKYIKTNKDMTKLWIVRDGLHKYIREIMEMRLTDGEILGALMNITASKEPDLIDNVHWYELNIEILNAMAIERGIKTTRINKLFMNRIEQNLRYSDYI